MKPASTFISKVSLVIFTIFILSTSARAGFEELNEVPNPPSAEDDNFTETPFTEYGKFNDAEEEADATRFFQYGRFFGVSVGLGAHGATGNRGTLWQGGFPQLAFRFHYWFDFNFALQIEYSTVSHYYDSNGRKDIVDVTLPYYGVDVKYYFDTHHLSAPITFAGPYLLLGGGNFEKRESSASTGVARESAFGFNLGAGLEFLISPRKAYFAIEGKFSVVNFEDRFSSSFTNLGLPDLTGQFFSFAGHIMWTW